MREDAEKAAKRAMAEPTPMPEIEVGDWMKGMDEFSAGPEIIELSPEDMQLYEEASPEVRQNALDHIMEIRKKDGRIWRREEPPR